MTSPGQPGGSVNGGAPAADGDRVDVERILRGIRDEIRRRHPEAELPAWQPPGEVPAGAPRGTGRDLEPLPPPAIFSPHLRYLNEHWQLQVTFPITSHRPVVGAFIVLGKKVVRAAVLGLFVPVFQSITAFFSNTTNFLNTLAKNLDDASNRLAANDRVLADRIRELDEERARAERELKLRIERAEHALVERMDLLYERLDRERLALEQRVEDLEPARTPDAG